MIRSSSARSSGSWPIARGLRSFGCTSRVGARDVQVAAEHERPAARLQRRGVGVHRLEKPHLGREILAAVRHVDRGDGQSATAASTVTMRFSKSNVRMGERRAARAQSLADVQARRPSSPCRRASSTSSPRARRARRDLVGGGLDLLQADDVRALALDPLLDLRLPRADSVDVPGGDLHGRQRHFGQMQVRLVTNEPISADCGRSSQIRSTESSPMTAI